MTLRREIVESPGEVHGAKNNERHGCGRRRVGEAAVSSKHSREGPKRTETYVEGTYGAKNNEGESAIAAQAS